jgi:hypothetical protein
LTAGNYLAGSLAVAAVVASLAWGAWRLRAALFPDWVGPPARLAEVTIGLAALILPAQLLGSFGAFERFPLLFVYVGLGVGMGLVGARTGRSCPTAVVPAPPPSLPREPRAEVVVAVAATAVVAAQWASHTTVALSRGITQPDSLWYHASFAGRFVQTARITGWSETGLEDLATPLHGAIPLNGSLVHGLAILPFGYDVLSPLLNFAWAALAVFAAWCLGRRFGVGALCVLGAVVVLGLPTLAGTQPGQAANDVVTAALFLTAIALLFEGDLAPVPTGLAAVAAGLALGTKLSVAVALGVITIGIVFLALRKRRWTTAVSWCGALGVSGGFWTLRNWVVTGNPTPWTDINLGPWTLDATIHSNPNLVGYLNEWVTWDRFILPGLSTAYTRAWPVLLALTLGGALLAVVRPTRPIERFAGAGILLTIVYHPFIPNMGDLGGGVFVFTLRYLTPLLMLGFALLAFEVAGARLAWRRGVLIAGLGLVVVDVFARHDERIAAWPTDHLLPGVIVGAGMLTVALAWQQPHTRRWVTGAVAVAVALVAVGWAGGWFVQDRYLEHRYANAGLPLDGANAVFRDVHDEQVVVFGTEELYPMFGLDVSNRVAKETAPTGSTDADLCASWRRILNDGGYDYIVMGHELWTDRGPAEVWIQSDAAVTQVLRDRDAVVYRVTGPLDPDGCA